MTLSEFLIQHADSAQLLNEMQTRGVVTAMAAAPHVISPSEWLPVMWGGDEQAPFESHEQFEQYANLIVDIWNAQRQQLLEKIGSGRKGVCWMTPKLSTKPRAISPKACCKAGASPVMIGKH